VFYINLPFGLLAAAGLMMFLPGGGGESRLRFNWFGFGVLTIGIGALQLVLDRGQELDWFTSREIIIEAVLASLGFYLFLVHVIYAPQPLIRPALFRDVNFASGVMLMFIVGTFMVSSLALMTPWLQVLSNYPVETAGLIMAPRGFGSLVTTMLGGRLATKVDGRLLVGIGLLMLAYTHLRGRAAGRRDGAPVHPDPGAGVRYSGASDADRGGVVVHPAAQPRRRDRCFRGHVTAGTQCPGDARNDRRVGHAVQSRLAGDRAHAAFNRPGDATRRGPAGPDRQPAGTDRRLCRRLRAADTGDGAGVAAAADDAPAAACEQRIGAGQ
jgi:hypothetical protein